MVSQASFSIVLLLPDMFHLHSERGYPLFHQNTRKGAPYPWYLLSSPPTLLSKFSTLWQPAKLACTYLHKWFSCSSEALFPFILHWWGKSLLVILQWALRSEQSCQSPWTKRLPIHEAFQICSLVYLFTLGVLGTLHKSIYLIWAEVSLFTERLHFVFILLLAFRCLTYRHEFHVPLYAAFCSSGTISVSYTSGPCLRFINLGDEDHFTFSIWACNCLTNEWYPDTTTSSSMTLQWLWILGNYFLATSGETCLQGEE